MPLWQLIEEQKLELFTDDLDDLLIHLEAGTKAVKALHRTDNEGQCERKYLQAAELAISGYLLFLEWEKIAQNKTYSG